MKPSAAPLRVPLASVCSVWSREFVTAVLGANKKRVVDGADPVKAAPSKKPKPVKIEGQTVEQHRRALGDKVKGAIDVEKWCIAARTHCTMPCAFEVFEQLVVPNASAITPATFDKATPVVVASVTSPDAAAEIFGRTKISGGTRMGSWHADRMDIIYLPPTGEMRCWWTMMR